MIHEVRMQSVLLLVLVQHFMMCTLILEQALFVNDMIPISLSWILPAIGLLFQNDIDLNTKNTHTHHEDNPIHNHIRGIGIDIDIDISQTSIQQLPIKLHYNITTQGSWHTVNLLPMSILEFSCLAKLGWR